MTTSFADFGLSPALLKSIEDLGVEEPSPTQTLAVPALLAGRDVVGQTRTGTGKTAAFGLPLLEKMTSANRCRPWCCAPRVNWPSRWPKNWANWSRTSGV